MSSWCRTEVREPGDRRWGGAHFSFPGAANLPGASVLILNVYHKIILIQIKVIHLLIKIVGMTFGLQMLSEKLTAVICL